MPVSLTSQVAEVGIGWIEVQGCAVGPSPPALEREIASAVDRVARGGDDPKTLALKGAVRDMLRHGRYRPTGRGKPSSEYLRHAALEGRFPSINTLVDINNLVSLETLLPISVVDLDRAGTEAFLVRWGREGESYVFNPSGQVLDLQDLLLVARMPGNLPCATPVKDCQETKTDSTTRAAMAVIYGPKAMMAHVHSATARMARLIETYCGGHLTWGLLS